MSVSRVLSAAFFSVSSPAPAKLSCLFFRLQLSSSLRDPQRSLKSVRPKLTVDGLSKYHPLPPRLWLRELPPPMPRYWFCMANCLSRCSFSASSFWSRSSSFTPSIMPSMSFSCSSFGMATIRCRLSSCATVFAASPSRPSASPLVCSAS